MKETPSLGFPWPDRTSNSLCTPMMSRNQNSQYYADCVKKDNEKTTKNHCRTPNRMQALLYSRSKMGPRLFSSLPPRALERASFPRDRRPLHIGLGTAVRLGVHVIPPRLNFLALPLIITAKS